MTPPRLVLASKSASRRMLLAQAGVSHDAEGSGVDERAVEAPLLAEGADPGTIAMHLAEAKALAVSVRRPGALVLGADQTLGLGNERFVKPNNVLEAHAQLMRLAGRTHALHSALAVAEGGKLIWRHISVARLTMRPLSPAFIERYLAAGGGDVMASVGCYQLEGMGIQLFENIDGDYFTILGLPMLPLLTFLRDRAVIDP
jgi:septum formation protein